MHRLSQIKAKKINSEEWVTGFYCEDTTPFGHKNKITPIIITNFSLPTITSYEIAPNTICRQLDFTLEDTPVYEGDVLYDADNDILYSVQWISFDSAFKFVEWIPNAEETHLYTNDELFSSEVNNFEDLKIVGNIHDECGLLSIYQKCQTQFQDVEDTEETFSIAEHSVIKKNK